MVDTCASVLARRGELAAADPTRLSPGWFAQVRDETLASDSRFSTIRPFLRACSAARSPASETEAAQEPSGS